MSKMLLFLLYYNRGIESRGSLSPLISKMLKIDVVRDKIQIDFLEIAFLRHIETIVKTLYKMMT